MPRQICYRGTANTWECDEMGHMNVRFYLGKAQEGLVNAGVLLGLGPRVLADMGAELVIEEQHIRFLRELQAGADHSIDVGVVEVAGDTLMVFQEFLPLAASHVSATLLSRLTLRNRLTGEPVVLPDAVHAAAGSLKTEVPDYGRPRTLPLDEPVLKSCQAEAIATGHLPVAIQTVRSGQVDAGGRIYPDQYMGYASDGIGNLFGLITKGADGEVHQRTEDIGGAALEYRFRYFDRARSGDTIKVYSGPARVEDKIYVIDHVFVDGETGETLARANSVHLAFNLKTRKSIPVPAALRRGLEAHLLRDS